MKTDYYTKLTRSELSYVKEVGAMPFILFQYYLTWQTNPSGINPSLQTIAADLDLEKNAVCNLRSKLIKAGWIRHENEQVFILKSFTKNERNHSQKMNQSFTKNERDHSQKMNKRSQKMNDIYKELELKELKGLKEKESTKEKTKETVATKPAPSPRGTRLSDPFLLTSEMRSWASVECPGVDVAFETKSFVDYFRGASGQKGVKLDWLATWRNWIRREFKNTKKTGGRNHAKTRYPDKNDKFEAGLAELATDPAFGFVPDDFAGSYQPGPPPFVD